MLLLQLLMLQLKLWAMKIPKQGKPFALVSENLRLRHSLQTMSNRCKDEFDIFHMLILAIVSVIILQNLHDMLTAITKLAIRTWKCMDRLVLVCQIFLLSFQANINTVFTPLFLLCISKISIYLLFMIQIRSWKRSSLLVHIK